jgi:type IV secretory pathway TrbD component
MAAFAGPVRDVRDDAPELEWHPVYTSLYRPVLFAGAEPSIVIVEVMTAFGLVFGVGVHVATVTLAVVYLTVVHSIMVWVATHDPQMSMLYVRSLSGADYYPPHARVRHAAPPARPAIPPVR